MRNKSWITWGTRKGNAFWFVYPPPDGHALHVDVRQGGVDLVRLASPGVPVAVLQTGRLYQAQVDYSSNQLKVLRASNLRSIENTRKLNYNPVTIYKCTLFGKYCNWIWKFSSLAIEQKQWRKTFLKRLWEYTFKERRDFHFNCFFLNCFSSGF